MGLEWTSAPLLLGLMALPVVWWLLRATPPAAKDETFGATQFLEGLNDKSETPVRTPWWVLLIRLLALGLIIVGLAGPVWATKDEGTGDGPLLIILDDSWPAAAGWEARMAALSALGTDKGAESRVTRFITPAPGAVLSEPMTLRSAIREVSSLPPRAAAADRLALDETLADVDLSGTDVFWLSDGTIGRRGADRDFLRLLGGTQSLTIFRDSQSPTIGIVGVTTNAKALAVSLRRIGGRPANGTLNAFSADGRLIATAPFSFAADKTETVATIDAPLEIRNEIASVRIAGSRMAGATWFFDAGDRRVRAGLVTGADATLLDSGFFIRQALAPVADIVTGEIETVTSPTISLIVLDDVGVLRPSAAQALAQWIDHGGVLLRFAGPNTANSETVIDGTTAPTFPVPLRGTDRSFGGAMTWASAQFLEQFSADGPFADIPLPEKIEVRRQVLARSGNTTQHQIWAQLTDGTPLITARRIGEGMVIMVHVTASPTWSDLPVSPVFADLMRTVAGFAAGLPTDIPDRPLIQYRQMDGFGNLTSPSPEDVRFTPSDIRAGKAAPGLYGLPETALAANTWQGGQPSLDRLTASLLPPGTQILGPDSSQARAFGPQLVALGLILLAMDALTLFLANRRINAAAALVFVLPFSLVPADGQAQEATFRPPLSEQAAEASLRVHFAYVITGDDERDRLSRAGLFGLARECRRRTSLEPADPLGVDLERDDLSVYPLIYWPIAADAPPPSEAALSRLERFMASGGLLIVDTQDGEVRSAGAETIEQVAARQILRRMNIPPLEPVAPGHILTRSFYRLSDLPGRNNSGNVWVDARSALQETTDAVPRIIIGSHDWAAAWAVDAEGIPLRPPGSRGERGREMAFRTGINFAMVALTGNYKGDQAGVQELLDKLEGQSVLP